MKVTRAQSEESRQAVINTASHLFRERGFDGIGLNDVMNAAGLTHGGFYNKFKSKEDLAIQATTRALDEGRVKWSRLIARAKGNPFAAIVRSYLSNIHRDDMGDGCAFAALGSDAARHGPALRQVFETEIEAHLDLLDNLSSVNPTEKTRDGSIATLSTMVGALMMSRAVNSPALSKRILDTSAEAIIAKTISKC